MVHVPLLADYGDGDQGVNEDLTRYIQGMYKKDARLTIAQIAEEYGFKFEQYINVKTSDGYFLTLHRIPSNGKVVFLNHGFYGSSVDWLMAGNESLPFMLSRLGYDVWLGNFRGNRYSDTHESLAPECAQYWDFSWDEFGNYDLPASIDYILQKTGQSKLTYIGYSVSSTAFFVMASLLPEYNDKIQSMIALSPMAWNTHVKSPLLRLFASSHDLERQLKSAIGHYEFRPSDLLTNTIRRVVCGDNLMSPVLCHSLPFLITGFNYKLLDSNNFYTISQHYPAGGSTKTLLHSSQNVVSRRFRRFDYPDSISNIDKYNSVNPPEYPVENIRVNVSLIVSDNDWLSNITDVVRLRGMLPRVGEVVFVGDYSAGDYLWARDVAEQVYDTVVRLIEKYSA
ncbi:hypothetical protein O0L34_g18561 [Tuta absoluta]|nr:hypothetical protein O0L34_g18561 [Tuta absoluta]